MIDKIKKLIMFIAIIFGVTLFAAEDKKAPNEIIKDNPKREVTTVESMKVRDHATMSLSVTKSKPEEIMGSLSEDGKLSVFLYKKQAKKSTRSASTKDIDIKNFKLKAYTNTKNDAPMMLRANTKDKNMPQNLSAEDIRSMMNSGTSSKEKKINVVEETDEYIRLEVEDVHDNEKVYISVMNGNSVVKSYRIGEIDTRIVKPGCWVIKNDAFGKSVIINSSSVLNNGATWLDYMTNTRLVPAFSGVVGLKMTKEPSNRDILKFKDDFFNLERNVNIQGVQEWVKGFRLRINATEYSGTGIYASNTIQATKVILGDGREGSKSTKNNFKDNIKFSLSNGGSVDDRIKTTFRELSGLKEGGPQCDLTERPPGNAVPSIQGEVIIGFNIGLEFSNFSIPGVYTYDNAMAVTLTHSVNNAGSFKDETIYANYKVDMGYPDSVSKNINIDSNNEVIIPENGDTLSFMRKNPTEDDGGIWYKTNGSDILLKPNKASNEDIWSSIFDVDDGNGNKIEVKVSQKMNEFAKVSVKNKAGDFKTQRTFKFTLKQGRKVSGSIRILRQIDYTVTSKLENIEIGELETAIDPRLGALTSEEWITLGSYSGGVSLDNLTSGKYLGLIAATTNKLSPQKTIKEITAVSTTNENYSYITGDDKGYKRYGMNNTPLVAIKITNPSGGITNTNILHENNNLARKIKNKSKVNFRFKAKDDYYYSFNHNLVVVNAPSGKPGEFIAEKGYIGRANLDLSGKELNTQYTLIKENENVYGNQINISGQFGWLPTFNGIAPGWQDKVIVDKYRVTIGSNNSGEIAFGDNNHGYNTSDGSLNIKLIRPNTVDNKKNIVITKKSDISYQNKSILIEYYHKSGIKLGEFTLNVSNTRTVNDLGESIVNIDSRIAQLNDGYSWMKLKNGEVFNLQKNGGTLGNYRDFIGVPSVFSKASSFSQYNSVKITNIEKINDSTTFTDLGFFGTDNIEYKGISQPVKNQAAYPTEQNLADFIDTDESTTKLVVSKWDVKSLEHTKENKFLVSGMNGNQPLAFTGNLKEKYLDKNGNEIKSVIDKVQNIFSGSGSLNLAPMVVGTSYWFDKIKPINGELKGNGNTEDVILKLGIEPDSLNAAGIISRSKNKRVANKMLITVNNKREPDVNLSNGKLEKELSIDQGKVKIAINDEGKLEVTKIQEGNIPSTVIKIEYYYKPSGNNNKENEIHLGTFNLIIENNVINSKQDVTVEIDKRFENLDGYNWLFRDGKVSNDITNAVLTKINGFSDFFTFSGNLDSQSGIIVRDIEMVGREVKNAGKKVAYGYYHLSDKTGNNVWKGEGAIPRIGEMSNLNNLITVSKGNDSSDSKSLENEFSLLVTDSVSRNKYSIYKGRIVEEIKGIGKYIGTGKIEEKDLIQNTEYTFSTIMTKMGTIPSNNNLSIEKATGTPVNALGVVSGKTSTVVANKISVKYKEENGNSTTEKIVESNGNLEVSLAGLKVGIDSSIGGLILQKTAEKINITEIVVDYLYEININGIKKVIDLGTFTLTIEKDSITIDPDDAFLDFGKMFYDSRDGLETHETREKSFKVINDTGKDIDFRVEKDTGKMMNGTNSLDLRNILVKKDSNKGFTLQATAVLNENTQSGAYQGEIQVIVDILDSKP